MLHSIQEVFHVYLNKFENAVTNLFLVIFGTVNILKFRTLKNNNYFLLFVILEITFQKKCLCS